MDWPESFGFSLVEASPFAAANTRTAMSSVCFKLALQSQSSDKFDTWDSLS